MTDYSWLPRTLFVIGALFAVDVALWWVIWRGRRER